MGSAEIVNQMEFNYFVKPVKIYDNRLHYITAFHVILIRGIYFFVYWIIHRKL